MSRIRSATGLATWYAAAFVHANVRVALAGVRTDASLDPTTVRVPVGLRGWRLALLANMVTLTPGTMSVDVPADESELVVHTLWGRDAAAVSQDVHSLQRRLGEVLT